MSTRLTGLCRFVSVYPQGQDKNQLTTSPQETKETDVVPERNGVCTALSVVVSLRSAFFCVYLPVFNVKVKVKVNVRSRNRNPVYQGRLGSTGEDPRISKSFCFR